MDRKIRLFDDINENHLCLFSESSESADDAVRSDTELNDVKRWQKLERRAQERGWTIALLQHSADSDRAKVLEREFALIELGGNDRTLVKGDLDTIEVFL